MIIPGLFLLLSFAGNAFAQPDVDAASLISLQTTPSIAAPQSTLLAIHNATSIHNRGSAGSSSELPTSSSSEAAASTPRIHRVKAGAGSFVFKPNELNDVSVGDVVTFEFYPPDHSVARAEFGSPCSPYEYTDKGKVGFWSGTQWVNTTDEIAYWNLTINSTEPIFYYCAAPDSCKEKQMIGVINPNSTQTLASQMLEAARADYQIAPGEPVPKEDSSGIRESPSRTARLSKGAIAGISIGCVVFLLIVSILLWYLCRRGRNGKPSSPADVRAGDDSASWPPADPTPAAHPLAMAYVSPHVPTVQTPPVELPGSGTLHDGFTKY